MEIGLPAMGRAAAMIELTETETPSILPRRQGALMIIAAGLIGAIVLLTILQNPLGPLSFVLLGIVAIAAVSKAWLVTRRDPIWLAFVLMLFELLSPCFFLTDRVRPIASYGLTLLFCLPAIPLMWQVWKARSSGFRLYLIYFGWCLITITYSLAPQFS